MTSTGTDHRGNPRNQIDCLIKLEPAGTREQHPLAPANSRPSEQSERSDLAAHEGIVQDASHTGARVWADQPYAPDEQLLIHFGCEKVGLNETQSCRATVIWAESEPVEGRWQIGIRFHASDASNIIARALTQGCPWCEKLCPDIAATPAADA